MSIVNEALKKTEKNRQQNRSIIIKEPDVVKAKKNRWPQVAMIGGSVLFITCAFFIFKDLSQKQLINFHFAKAAPKITQPKIPKIAPTPSNLVLNGTIGMGDQEMAVINHHQYRVGDRLGQDKVIAISSYEVKLLSPNGVIMLHAQ